MKKSLVEKVVKNLIVDTRKYRYVLDQVRGEIKRIQLEYLDTTAAIDGWEVVKKM